MIITVLCSCVNLSQSSGPSSNWRPVVPGEALRLADGVVNMPPPHACVQVFVTNVTQDTQDAADIVLVVDESGSMINEQTWLLVMVPFLERILTNAGWYSLRPYP